MLELNTSNCSGILSCAGFQSVPITTPQKLAFLNNVKRLRRIRAGSRFGTDPQFEGSTQWRHVIAGYDLLLPVPELHSSDILESSTSNK